MKNMILNKYFIIGLILLFSLASCNDYEDVPVEITTIDYVFDATDSLGFRAQGYLADMYSKMYNGHERFKPTYGINQTSYLEAATDNAISSVVGTDNDVMRLGLGNYSSSNMVAEEMSSVWSAYYAGIRQANVFIKHIDDVPLLAKYTNDLRETYPLNRAWKAEARFLRALYYFELVKRFGGVPLMGDRISELSDNLELSRNSYADCIDYIVAELDDIKDSLRVLPLSDPTTVGFVATKNAALALKSRVLLYAASPLFNEKSIEPDNELVGYTNVQPDAVKERWAKASKAAKEFIDTYGDNGQKIHGLTSDFLNIFLADYPANKEVIFVRYGGNGNYLEKTIGPIGFSLPAAMGEGMCSPTQDLVDAFPMKDGKSIKESTAYDSTSLNMYKNRDPRLGYTILYQGSTWLKTKMELFEGGINNPSGQTKKTKTGYYMRKFMQKAENSETYGNANHRWIMFRYAEILLNYAEAENEVREKPNQPDETIIDALIALRKRAGIDMGRNGYYGLNPNMTKEEMRKAIQNERRIELAFEEHRFFDIRRWRIAEEVYKKPLRRVVINKEGTTYTVNIAPVLSVTFDPKRNLHPIPYPEVIKNKNMKQNPGW